MPISGSDRWRFNGTCAFVAAGDPDTPEPTLDPVGRTEAAKAPEEFVVTVLLFSLLFSLFIFLYILASRSLMMAISSTASPNRSNQRDPSGLFGGTVSDSSFVHRSQKK